MKTNPKSFSRNLQKYDWDCGVAAVGFLMDNKGHNVPRKKLLKELGASAKVGTDLVKIVKFFESRPEFEAKVKGNSSLNWVERELDRGRAALVAYQNWQKPGDIGEPDWGHYGVIYKIVEGKVYLFDPGEKDGLTEFTKEEFEKRWHEDDLGIHYEKWAMSVDLGGKKKLEFNRAVMEYGWDSGALSKREVNKVAPRFIRPLRRTDFLV